jgi:hypothetical protein
MLRLPLPARRLRLSFQTLLPTPGDAIDGATRAPVALRQKSAAGSRTQSSQKRQKGNKMEYVVVLGVAMMIGLYALIIRRCLQDA